MNVLFSLHLMLGFCKGRNRSVVSFVYFISIIGIAVGISVLIIGLSAINGFKYELENKILALVPHIEITSINPLLVNWQNIYNLIHCMPEIISISTYIDFIGLIEFKNKLNFIHIRGIDLQNESQILLALNKINNDVCKLFFFGDYQILLGKGIADILKVHKGDWVNIILPNKNLYNKLLFPKFNHLQVVDIFCFGSLLDYNLALIPLKDAQFYLITQQGVEGLSVKVNNIFKVHKLIEKITLALNDSNLFINGWISKYGYIYEDIQIIRVIIYFSMLLVVFISSFGIFGILIIGIKEKIYDVAILKSFGANRYLIQTIFIFRGLSIGFFGSLIGVIIGVLVSLNLKEFVNVFEYIIKRQLFSVNVYFIEFLPSIVSLKDIIIVVLTELFFSFLISWYPSLYVNRIQLSKLLK